MNTLHTIFDWLIAASLRSSALTLLVFALQWLLQRHLSPRWRYSLWLPVLVVLIAPVLPESRWSIESVFQPKPQPVEVHSAPLIADIAPVSLPSIAPPVVSAPAPLDWNQIQLVTWALGACLLLLIGSVSFLGSLLRFRQSRESVSDDLLSLLDAISREVGLRHSPQVLVAPAIQSPAVTGLLRPTLLLPAGFERDFTAEEARLILQHELTHLKRHDLPLNTLLCVLMALHWFNPLLWLAFFKARADREAACDAQVLVNATPQRRSEYGHALLKVEAAFAPFRLSLGFIGMLQRGAALRARIRSIAQPSRTRPLAGLLATLCITCMTFLGVTRAEKPAAEAEARDSSKWMSLEIQIISFNRESNWNLGGRLTTPPPGADKSPTGSALQTQTLGGDELNKLLKDTLKQPGAHQSAYPRMVVEEGKESMIRSVVNQPVPGQDKDGKDSIVYVPIGFAGKFTAKQYSDDKILLHIDITNSEIIGETKIGGQPYPVARSSAYRATEEVPVGTSCAVYGWQEHGGNKVEAPGRRPVLYIITPKRIQPGEAGLTAMGGTLFGEALRKADELRQASPKTYERSKSTLGEVLQLLATDAGIRFVNLPADHPANKKLITFTIRASPFKILEAMCEANGLTLGFDQGVWQVHPSNFTVGNSSFLPGDSIRITQVQRSGGFMTVTADYELASAEAANISLYITSTKDNGRTKTDPNQRKAIAKGKGRVVLHHPDVREGMPHVSFYPSGGGSSFGGIYFGTQEEADASRKMSGASPAASASSRSSSFTVGQTAFRSGDSIQITSVERSADQLSVTAEYELASADAARIALFITSKDKGRTKVEAGQSKTIAKGKGSVVLHHPHLHEGLPHLSFYGAENGRAFGSLYFGTPEQAEASKKLDLSHISANKPVDATASALNAKLNRIILPRVQFSGASIEEAVEYLHAKSREFDTLDKTGVQLILRPGVTKPGLISLDLKDVPLIEALRYCTELAGLTYKIEPYAVTIAATTTEAPAKLEMTTKSDAKAIVATRANKIILPSVEFRDATLVEAIEFIRAKSREHDPDKKGVNILLKGDGDTVKITLSLIDVPVPEALHYCAELSSYKLSADENSFVLTPAPPKKGANTSQHKPTQASSSLRMMGHMEQTRRLRKRPPSYAAPSLSSMTSPKRCSAMCCVFSLPMPASIFSLCPTTIPSIKNWSPSVFAPALLQHLNLFAARTARCSCLIRTAGSSVPPMIRRRSGKSMSFPPRRPASKPSSRTSAPSLVVAKQSQLRTNLSQACNSKKSRTQFM